MDAEGNYYYPDEQPYEPYYEPEPVYPNLSEKLQKKIGDQAKMEVAKKWKITKGEFLAELQKECDSSFREVVKEVTDRCRNPKKFMPIVYNDKRSKHDLISEIASQRYGDNMSVGRKSHMSRSNMSTHK